MIQLTVLIPTIPSRFTNFQYTYQKLLDLAQNRAIILGLTDNKNYDVGTKRNFLMDMVTTPYMTFFDDDDEPYEDYFNVILDNIEKYPQVECFGMTGYQSREGTKYGEFDFDIKHSRQHNPRQIIDGVRIQTLIRKPNHICIWQSHIARRVPFPAKSLGEDHHWADLQQLKGYNFQKLETDKLLYHYKFDKFKTETRLR